jgi:hypothetical protein
VAIEPDPRCRHQVFDIPVVRFSVIEHQLFGGYCSGCGKHHCAQTPGSVPVRIPDFSCAKFSPFRLTLSQNLNFLDALAISRFVFRGRFIGPIGVACHLE